MLRSSILRLSTVKNFTRRSMHWVQFEHNGSKKVGVLDSTSTSESPSAFIDLTATDATIPNDVRSILMAGSKMNYKIESAISSPNRRMVSQKDIKLLAPVNPGKVILIGLNYTGHCKEQNVPLPELPVIVARFADTVIGPSDNVQYSDETKELDWEVELAIVIGSKAKNVEESSAMEYVFGYTIANDLSARDLQKTGNARQWTLGKNLDTSCPLGPWIVSKDAIADPHNLGIRCRVNGVTKQDGNTNEMVFKTPRLVSYISRFMSLYPGDIIITGTPAGVGFARNPPEFLKRGDVVECEIDQIGCLTNKIV